MTPSSYSDEDFMRALTPHKKKLYWRSIRRGMKEADIICGGFARRYLADMNTHDTAQFEAILHTFDQDLISWITGQNPVPADLDTPVFHLLKNFIPYEGG